MDLERKQVSFCLYLDLEDKQEAIDKIVDLDLDYFDEVSYERGESAELKFQDESELVIDEQSDEEEGNSKLHVHYTADSEKSNYGKSEELIQEIMSLVGQDSLSVNFIAVGGALEKGIESILSINIDNYQTNIIDISNEDERILLGSDEGGSHITMREEGIEANTSLNDQIEKQFENLKDFVSG